jgi:DNA-binding MarR family transcriptional regulator
MNVPSKRQLDLLATLDEKERKIVQYVQHHAPSSVRVSRMRRDLLIPKTSLTRTLSALERKQFLSLGKVGFRAHAELHKFYKG